MRRFTLFIAMTFGALSAFAHAGHIHNYLGVVKLVDASHMVITTTEKKDVEVTLARSTRYTRNGGTARNADVKPGLRVSVYVAEDGKTAKTVMLPPSVATK